jgi:glycosyltransferase involved in cell wall biosynthesis
VGNDLERFDAGAKENMERVGKLPEEFWVTYAGTIGTSYDIRTLLLAGEELANRGYSKIRIKILGGGPLKEELEALAAKRQIYNVEFVGYAPYERMAAYLTRSDVVVNSFVRKAPQSIVTKIGDYLASGKAMINTCMSPEFRKKVETDGFGINIEPENVEVLADAIVQLYEQEQLRLQMGENARKIAKEQFDRKIAYKQIVALVKEVMKEG